MGAWVGRVNCFYISWKRSFHSPVELDLTPTWPILWSSDRVTAPQPATHLTFFSNQLIFLLDNRRWNNCSCSSSSHYSSYWIRKTTRQGWTPISFQTRYSDRAILAQLLHFFPLWAFPLVTIGCRQSCRLFWFGEAEAGTCASKHVFTKSFIDSGYPKHPMPELGETCYSRQGPDMNWKYGYMHGLRLRSMDSEFPSVRWDSGWNSALQTTEKIRHNTSCSGGEAQDESEMSIEFTLRARIQHVCLNIK